MVATLVKMQEGSVEAERVLSPWLRGLVILIFYSILSKTQETRDLEPGKAWLNLW